MVPIILLVFLLAMSEIAVGSSQINAIKNCLPETYPGPLMIVSPVVEKITPQRVCRCGHQRIGRDSMSNRIEV